MSILYEDRTLLILNKPSGTPSAPINELETETAVHLALNYFPQLQGVGDKPLEPGLVHRLDTGTSGALVFAKTQAEFQRLKQLWRERKVTKIYRAVAHPAEDTPSPVLKRLPLRVDFPLAHHAKSKKKMIALTQPSMRHFRGRPIPAVTHVLESFPLQQKAISPELAPGLLDLTIEIETGVMHQIRCHLQALGMPIWGDPVYERASAAPLVRATRLWLHAWKIGIPSASGELLQIEAPLPEDWPGRATS